MLEEELIKWGTRGLLDQLVEQYWSDVESLLATAWEDSEAHEKVARLREKLRALPGPAVNVMIYHQEPFTLAAELAGVDLLRERERYVQAARRAGIDLEGED